MKVLAGLRPLLDAMGSGAAVLVEITPTELEARGSTASEVVNFLTTLGFKGYVIPNSYEPECYLDAAPGHLSPLSGAPSDMVDALFLR